MNVDAGNEPVRLFELARVYLPSGEPASRRALARRQGSPEAASTAARAALEAIYAAFHLPLEVRRARSATSSTRARRPRRTRAGSGSSTRRCSKAAWGVFELDVAALMAAAAERILYEDVITYPANRQDIAVVVDEDVEAGAIVAAAREAGGAELREAKVFDVYHGDQVGDGAEVRRAPPRLPGAGPDAHRRGRGSGAGADRAALAERFGAELRG